MRGQIYRFRRKHKPFPPIKFIVLTALAISFLTLAIYLFSYSERVSNDPNILELRNKFIRHISLCKDLENIRGDCQILRQVTIERDLFLSENYPGTVVVLGGWVADEQGTPSISDIYLPWWGVPAIVIIFALLFYFAFLRRER
ncbi:MAG: hypothetical protein NZ822_02005 [Patescibacteria group bacterium]|nr:hypothetical protein [Patescibacteria group bacterium]